jgi:uncharacterized membrane protein YfcA
VTLLAAAAIGFLAGTVSGMLGVGGGILFVPALSLLLGLNHVDAEATSLLAIVPVSAVGAWRQARYGNLRVHDGLLLGAMAIPGAIGGVALANILPVRVLKIGFALLLLFAAGQLVVNALRKPS